MVALPELGPLTVAEAIGGLSLAWLGLYELGLVGRFDPAHESRTAHGTAAWAGRRDLKKAGLLAESGLVVGRDGGRLLRLGADRHVLTLAPTRSGKGVAAVIPNLLTYPGSVVVIDPKGENAAVTARRRREMGQDVHVLDPWHITGLAPSMFNPLDLLGGENLSEDAALLADAMVQPTGRETDGHWIEEARALLTSLILHVATAAPPHLRNLPHIRHLLTLGPDDFTALLTAMTASGAAGGLVARDANRLLQKVNLELSGVISTAQAQTHFLDSEHLGGSLCASSFDLTGIKRRRMTIYLVLPATRLQTHARWLRLMISATLSTIAAETVPPALPVLFLLDEFAALGRLSMIETAMGLMAGFGLRLWPILQDLSQLKDLYPNRWESFIANADIQAFAVSEPGTAEYLSRMLGSRTVTVRNETAREQQMIGTGYSTSGRPLLMPDELRRLPPDREILLVRGSPPVLTGKACYYSDPEFRGMFDRNPLIGGGHDKG